jgi:hypothetical protein
VNAHIAALLQPLYQHLQAILRQPFTRVIGFPVIVAKPRRIVLFLDPEPSFIRKLAHGGEYKKETTKIK